MLVLITAQKKPLKFYKISSIRSCGGNNTHSVGTWPFTNYLYRHTLISLCASRACQKSNRQGS